MFTQHMGLYILGILTQNNTEVYAIQEALDQSLQK